VLDIYWEQRGGDLDILVASQLGEAFAILSLICEGTIGKSMGSIQTLEIA
jgi:hypothetical protein